MAFVAVAAGCGGSEKGSGPVATTEVTMAKSYLTKAIEDVGLLAAVHASGADARPSP